jgi:hypothetical protein
VQLKKILSLKIFYLYVLFILSYLFPFPYFQTLISNLGFNSTSSNYYIIIINLIILFNAQTYKLQHDAFFYHLFGLISKFCVCSFYDANEAHKIEEISLLFFVYNLEYYKSYPLNRNLVPEICEKRDTERLVCNSDFSL